MIKETIAGVYVIKTLSGFMYIGSSENIKRRFGQHISCLKKGVNHNSPLQAYYNEFGKDSLTFEVLEYVEDVSQLLDREQFWIDSFDFDLLFNRCPNSKSALGAKRSKEARENMSASHRGKQGRPHTEETKRKLSIKHKGKTHSIETNEKLRNINLGKTHSEEYKLKLSLKTRGIKKPPRTEEHSRKISEAKKGIKKNKVICPHCGKEGGEPIMKRYHFDRCKLK